MGQGGHITLVNGTKYDWKRTYQHQYQMNSWQFPDTIPAGQSVSVYVEWDQGVGKHQHDDAGEATYTLEQTGGLHFQVQARNRDHFDLRVVLNGLEAQHAPRGTTIDLGWRHDGYVNFVLAGKVGSFVVSGRPAGAWMQENLPVLGDRTLRQLCLPGSHDAGMSQLVSGTAHAHKCNTLTQSVSIGQQLAYGARYFDIRPVISGGQFLTGHYSYIKALGGWQGGNGQSIEAIIDEVNGFTAANAELVILHLSHDLNTDLGNSSYKPLTQTDWNNLLTKLAGLNHLFVVTDPTVVDLSLLKLTEFIGENQAAVVVIVEPDDHSVSLGRYENQGFFPPNRLSIFNQYADSNDVEVMIKNQLGKMLVQRPKPTSPIFLLSWTLTQSGAQAAFCLTSARSIQDLADIANPQLYARLLPACTAQCYPNILYTDYVQSPDVAAMAMAVNWLPLT